MSITSYMISSLRSNKQQLKKRKNLFERNTSTLKETYGKLENKSKFSNYEKSSFQKTITKRKKEYQKKTQLLIILTIMTIVLLIVLFPYIVEFIFSGDLLSNKLPKVS